VQSASCCWTRRSWPASATCSGPRCCTCATCTRPEQARRWRRTR
jgi:hypothetical protein